MGRLIATAGAVLALSAAGAALARTELVRDDDRPVPLSDPAAQRAIAIAREIVPGRVREVRRDEDNGKWEVTIRRRGSDFEVELDPRDLSLLRLDYD